MENFKAQTFTAFLPQKPQVTDTNESTKTSQSGESRSRYDTAKELFKRVGVLLMFHLFNIVVSIGGIISVVLMLGSIALLPAWFAGLMFVVPAILPGKMSVFLWLVLLGLYCYSLLSCNLHCKYVPLGSGAVLGGTFLELGFFLSFEFLTKYLLTADVHLAMITYPNSKADTLDLDPKQCMERFELSDDTSNIIIILPQLSMTRRLWVAVLFFAGPKVILGALSAAAIFSTVVQPLLAIFSGSNMIFFAGWVTNDVAYVIWIIAFWMLGAVGMPIVAAASAKLTLLVCGDWESEIKEIGA